MRSLIAPFVILVTLGLGGCDEGSSQLGDGGDGGAHKDAAMQRVPAPQLSPASGAYEGDQTVTITDAEPGAVIHYTLDGSEPSSSSPTYAAPFVVQSAGSTTVKAIAVKAGLADSAVASVTYELSYPVATPQLDPAGGTYDADQSVTISCETEGVTIYYTLDGSAPSSSSSVYSGPIAVAGDGTTTTIKAIAVGAGSQTSGVASGSYTISYPAVAAPQLSPAGGTYDSDQSVAISTATAGATIYYTTDGSEPSTSSAVYSAPIDVAGDQTTLTIKAMAVKSGMLPSPVVSATYAISYGLVATPQLSPPGGSYSSDQAVTISCETAGATIYYTTDGSEPSTSSSVYSGLIAITGDGTTKTIKVLAVKPGMRSSTASATYTISYPQVATPQLSPSGGTYSVNQSVTISTTTLGAKIYYTTDGGEPSASSLSYIAPIAIKGSGTTKTIRAIALKPGMWLPSEIASASYTIQSCVTGRHDGGNGSCVHDGACASNHYLVAADGSCVRFTATSVGFNHTCGLKSDDSVACRGENAAGQAPATVAGPFVSVSAGGSHTCALRPDGNVACWGNNYWGQAPPAGVTGPFLSVDAGTYHNCALRWDGTIVCWGYNDDGRAPATVAGPFVSVSAGGSHTCAVKPDGNVACWGNNTSGQAPATVAGPFVSVSAGGSHTCAVKPDDNVACWGYNTSGEAPPAGVTGPFLSVAAGHHHTCAVKGNSSIACWGDNYWGQAPPAGVTGPFLSVGAGAAHTCALKPNGTIACWGDNSYGQAPSTLYPN